MLKSKLNPIFLPRPLGSHSRASELQSQLSVRYAAFTSISQLFIAAGEITGRGGGRGPGGECGGLRVDGRRDDDITVKQRSCGLSVRCSRQ